VILPDVNILIYAFRTDAAEHRVWNPWLTDVVASDRRFAISPLALSALVRITTGRAYTAPRTLEEAFGFCNYLTAQPNCEIVEPGERHWDIFQRLCHQTNTRGPRVTDAWFAALAIEWSCEWVTMDRDFARFPGLTLSVPKA
jgi:toxin-antitoxin system PIN domain toxin